MDTAAGKSDAEREGLRGFEGWLRSPTKRALLILLLLALIAGTRTYQLREWRQAFGGAEVGWQQFLYQAGKWGIWAALIVPVVYFALWLQRRAGWWAFLAVQLPLSLAVGVVVLEYHPWLFHRIYGAEARAWRGNYDFGPRTAGSRFDGARGERREGPRGARGEVSGGTGRTANSGAPSGERQRDSQGRGGGPDGRQRAGPPGPLLRSPRHVAVYWIILGIGAGVHAFLRTRTQERRATDLELRAAQLKAELANAQVDTLRTQLHPHFLFNALHTIGGLIRARDLDTALRSLAALGLLLRSTLDQGERQEVRVSEELATAERYLGIEAIRFGERLEHEVTAGEGTLDARLPAMLLLPLVENAVRYGVEPNTEGGRVEVRVEREGEQLLVEVLDGGPGFPSDVLLTAEGRGDGRPHIGLANTRDRLRALYGDEHSFTLENRPEGGARIRIAIPFRVEQVSEEKLVG